MARTKQKEEVAPHIFDIIGVKPRYTVTEIARGLHAVHDGSSIAAKRQQIWRAINNGSIRATKVLPQLNGGCSTYLIAKSQLPKIYEEWELDYEPVE